MLAIAIMTCDIILGIN